MKNSPNPKVTDKYAYRITDTIASTITGTPQTDPIAKQYIPTEAELRTIPEEHPDPIGDDAHTPVKGIVHRYPDRVLFKPANICAVYCRYCFRREMVGPNNADILTDSEITAALDYIRNHDQIWEVIFTGGDPLIISPRQLSAIMAALDTIPHVKVIRFHTRIPIADPKRVHPELITAIKSTKATYIALHINHASELTNDTRRAIHDLHTAGITLLSQSVLLKDVNNNPETLETLYRELVALNVKPYYLHHPDFAPGTSHFRLSIKEGQAIVKSLQGRLSGLCQPTYMLDTPGGHGKIPLTPCFIKELKEDTYSVKNYKGETFTYPPPVKKK
ncbi:MAG: lysine-2,3-aminomutase-like protein [Alphaproteobacteria bacterium]